MEYPYELIRSSRKTIAIQIRSDGHIVVRAPKKMPAAHIRQFVEKKSSWIQKHLSAIQAREVPTCSPFTEEELRQLAEAAHNDIPQRVSHFAPLVGVTFGKITIRKQRTRWGSCSSKGNLNFNCLLMLCPEDVRDYVVVHELCHRKEMNHTPKFWAHVERVLPHYKESRKRLKENGNSLIERLP